MADPIDTIVPMLREMRSEAERQLGELKAGSASIIPRRDKLESTQRSFERALSADSLLGRLSIGEFEDSIEAPEGKVREREARR